MCCPVAPSRLRAATLFIVLLGGLAASARAQTSPPPSEDRPVFHPPNSIQIGDFRLTVRVRLHQDFRRFSSGAGEGWEPTFRRARVGVQGQVSDNFEYDFDAELRDEAYPLRNVFVNYGGFELAEIRVGRFKVPFGREQLASIFELDFIERSLINTALAPTRDTGVMVHGEVADGIVAYRAGVFAHDGDTARFERTLTGNQTTLIRAGDGAWAGRLIVSPWAQSGGPLRRVEVGVAMTMTSMQEGAFGIEGRTLSGFRFFPRVRVQGRRTRVGVDGSWLRGPFGVQAEYIRLRDERDGGGTSGADLGAVVARGWYVSAAWTLTGEAQGQEFAPRRPLFRGGFGTIEAAARAESLSFSSASADVRANRDLILTAGVNWYPNRWGRIMLDITREHLADAEPTPVGRRSTVWGVACRLQLVL